MKTIENLIKNRKKTAILIIFFIALVFRVFIILNVNENYIAPDSTGYHRIATNIVLGNGHSMFPPEPTFFREPGYNYYLAISLQLFELFGGKVDYIKKFDVHSRIINESRYDVLFAKFFQAVTDSVSVVMFFLLMLLVLRPRWAFIISILFAFYYPHVFQVTFLLRETLLTFLTISMSYFFGLYLVKKKKIYFYIFSIFSGLACLTFQVMILIPIFCLILLYVKIKNVKKSILLTIVNILIIVIIVSPWILTAYNYYPSWKVVKTLGVSFTHELNAYCSSVTKLVSTGKLDKNKGNKIRGREWNTNSYQQFERSFNGYYKGKTKENLKLVKNEERNTGFLKKIIGKFKRTLKNIIPKFRKTWFHTKIFPKSGRLLVREMPILMTSIFGILFLSGFLSIFGLILFYKELYHITFSFTMFISIFFVIGSEYRRMMPCYPFMFMFTILAIIFLYYKFYKKMNYKEILREIFI